MEEWERRLGDEDAALYPIGVVAELLNVDVQVVRRLEAAGVVEPARSEARQRRYSRRDIARLAHALRLADEGIPTAGIKRIMDLEDVVRDLTGTAEPQGSQLPG